MLRPDTTRTPADSVRGTELQNVMDSLRRLVWGSVNVSHTWWACLYKCAHIEICYLVICICTWTTTLLYVGTSCHLVVNGYTIVHPVVSVYIIHYLVIWKYVISSLVASNWIIGHLATHNRPSCYNNGPSCRWLGFWRWWVLVIE